MYDELVKRLHRYTENCVAYKLDADFADAVQKAADAIEELVGFVQEAERDRDEYRERLDKANDAIEELQKLLDGVSADNDSLCERIDEPSKPLWIPVTDEPPLKVGDDGYNGYLVYANGYYEVADYTTDKFDNVPYFHVDGEYEPDVTHYMPLPEPPKEEI
jgi:hypothetical protein